MLHKLEVEIVDLRKKVEKSNKFLNSSQILDEILESQRSPCDKSRSWIQRRRYTC